MRKPSLNHWIGWVRWVALLEGVSYLVLLFVAMPLKYFADMPGLVRVVGSVHGGLFVVLAVVTGLAWLMKKLDFRLSALVMLASLVPFGPFFLDRRLAKIEAGG